MTTSRCSWRGCSEPVTHQLYPKNHTGPYGLCGIHFSLLNQVSVMEVSTDGDFKIAKVIS